MNRMIPRACALIAGVVYLAIAAFSSVLVPVAAFCVDDPNASVASIAVCVLAIVAIPVVFLLSSVSLIVSFFFARSTLVRVVQWVSWLAPWALLLAYFLFMAVSGL